MSSSSFIDALCRFESIRGKVKQYRSDRGTNLIGATEDLQVNTINVDDEPVKAYMYDTGVTWIFNPPHSSHIGGSWERMIGMTKKILDSIMLAMGKKNFTHEVLVTSMCKVSAIVNNRPITPIPSDPDNPYPLTPNVLLTSEVGQPVEPLHSFNIKNMYSKQWKRVQTMAELSWKCWRREYIHALQTIRKWKTEQPNKQKGYLVILKEKDMQRNEWPLGVITESIGSDDSKVQKVIVRISKDGKTVSYTRPISEIVLLLPKSDT